MGTAVGIGQKKKNIGGKSERHGYPALKRSPCTVYVRFTIYDFYSCTFSLFSAEFVCSSMCTVIWVVSVSCSLL